MWSPYFTNGVVWFETRDRIWSANELAYALAVFPKAAIDHCLVSSEISIHALRLGSHVGSDHRPLITELSFWQEVRFQIARLSAASHFAQKSKSHPRRRVDGSDQPTADAPALFGESTHGSGWIVRSTYLFESR